TSPIARRLRSGDLAARPCPLGWKHPSRSPSHCQGASGERWPPDRLGGRGMSLAILPRHTEGRLEFLEDRKGIYGLTWPDPYHADQDPHCYILRPDRLEEERHC